uniref:At1g61320/AtMIF1 LRR domain-containing protein n=1 Tax=Arundo donax TaxID=35708 RepID=A0A0A9BBZ8_ARUDO
MSYLMDYPCKFSLLKHLKLKLLYVEDVDSISLASFLSSARFIEELELHFSVDGFVHVVQEPIRRLLDCPFKYMKSLCCTGFKACHGQVQLLLHMVENAPALEVFIIDLSNKYKPTEHEKIEEEYADLVHATARRYLEGKISAKCTLRLL